MAAKILGKFPRIADALASLPETVLERPPFLAGGNDGPKEGGFMVLCGDNKGHRFYIGNGPPSEKPPFVWTVKDITESRKDSPWGIGGEKHD